MVGSQVDVMVLLLEKVVIGQKAVVVWLLWWLSLFRRLWDLVAVGGCYIQVFGLMWFG